MADMPDFYNKSGKKLGAGLGDYLELFTLTTIGETDLANLNAFQTAENELNNIESKKSYEKVRDKISTLSAPENRVVLSRLELTINYNQIKRLRPQLINKWNKYLEVLEAVGNDIFTKTETSRHEQLLNELNLFL